MVCSTDGKIIETNNPLSKLLDTVSAKPISLIDKNLFELNFQRIMINRANEAIKNFDNVKNGLYEFNIDGKLLNIHIIETTQSKIKRILKSENMTKISEN